MKGLMRMKELILEYSNPGAAGDDGVPHLR